MEIRVIGRKEEYDPHSKKLRIKRSDHCLYDYSCKYLLADERVAEMFGKF